MKIQQVANFSSRTVFLGALLMFQGATLTAANPFDNLENRCFEEVCDQYNCRLVEVPCSQSGSQNTSQEDGGDVALSCGNYGLPFQGPLEWTPYQEALNDGPQNPGPVYVIFSMITSEMRPNWTQNNGIWEVTGPFDLRAGKGYLLEFGPQTRQVRMIEGPLPYYVEGTASWVQVRNTDTFRNSYAYCIVSANKYNSATQSSTPSQTQTGANSRQWRGTLTRNSRVFDDGTFYNAHLFTGQAGDTIQITLETQAFDGLLILVDPQGEAIAQIDDNWKGEKETLVIKLPDTGEYTIVVNSYEAGETGDYLLSLNQNNSAAQAPTASPEVALQEVTLFDNNNIYGVRNSPSSATQFSLPNAARLTYFMNYHWNDARGQAPGTMWLTHQDGTTYGPWQATTQPGQGGVPNAYWIVRPNVTLKAGNYTIGDSHPSSWANNQQSGFKGMSLLKGVSLGSANGSTGNAGNGTIDCSQLEGLDRILCEHDPRN
ncbi:hypothetical protein FEK30_11655 [Picosynechococcus sp. PCC 11901]|uniref:PPC domain-containing protein n=1 Tax=Picosynechococcus sp. PCC 11901 TaxID=2579791 RepID=UPI0010FC2F4A|nr:PPC domain-containing protein [Picosynechococcus sp. PCC 11901]QCS50036.1 hypothetical protein FEK30_11655 [Picosynechococcus sp. PCC 11901]